ncbi:hypothetical protein GDO81_007720 [Engystomops pustulosus]|uniref:Uncharacterized protein n=1 Tax=Engystomops pustulosus TaxID=76066 RepID=A0AAV7CAZ1_ENGPU|nr:hypothetical protein GDO81_007720 [Engystomops pustulosus]
MPRCLKVRQMINDRFRESCWCHQSWKTDYSNNLMPRKDCKGGGTMKWLFHRG